MNEFELIAKLIPKLATNDHVVTGAGDDCAVLDVGINTLAREHEVAIVGGETTTCPERVFISVAMIGLVSKAICRKGAKVGDGIFVTGQLGGSLQGRHLEFEPRLKEARWLADHFD